MSRSSAQPALVATPLATDAPAPALSTMQHESEGDYIRGRGGVADQGGPPDLPRRPPHCRPPPPPRRPRRRGLPRLRAAPFPRGLHPPLPAPSQGRWK